MSKTVRRKKRGATPHDFLIGVLLGVACRLSSVPGDFRVAPRVSRVSEQGEGSVHENQKKGGDALSGFISYSLWIGVLRFGAGRHRSAQVEVH